MPDTPQVLKSADQACSYCGGRTIARGLVLNQNADAGTVGLLYRSVGIFMGTEALHADLCASCGTVLRFYVKEPGRKWLLS